MNQFPASFFAGFFSTAALFVLCFLTVAGGKACLIAAKRFIKKIRAQNPPPQPEVQTPTPEPAPAPVKKRARKPVRTIEIDPDSVDRIYVKKN